MPAISSDRIRAPHPIVTSTNGPLRAEAAFGEERDPQRSRRRGLAFGATAAVISLLALLGQALSDQMHLGKHWLLLAGGLGEKLNMSVEPLIWYHPMVRDAAVSLLILASVFLLVQIRKTDRWLIRRLVQAASIAVLSWSLWKFFAVFSGEHRAGESLQDLMSPIAELSLIAVAVSLCLLASRKRRFLDFAGTLCVPVIFVNMICVVSYAISLPACLIPNGNRPSPTIGILPLFYGEYGDKTKWSEIQGLLVNPVALNASIGYLCIALGVVYNIGSSHFPLRLAAGLPLVL